MKGFNGEHKQKGSPWHKGNVNSRSTMTISVPGKPGRGPRCAHNENLRSTRQRTGSCIGRTLLPPRNVTCLTTSS